MNDCKIVQLTKNNYKQLLDYLVEIDNIFPVPMSSRVNIIEHAHKLLDVGIVIVATNQDNKIVGVLLGYANDYINGRGYLATLGVSQDYRELGIGTRLVSTFVKICGEKNMKFIGLHAHRSNVRAIAFYERNGFSLSKDNDKPYDESVYLTRVL